MTKEEKVTALFQDVDTLNEVFTDNADQTLANLAAHGIEMSREELEELSAGFLEGAGASNEELSEEALENVAGGGIGVDKICKSVKNVITAAKKGASDKRNKSVSGMKYVESAKTIEGKGWRAIGYTVGYVFGR